MKKYNFLAVLVISIFIFSCSKKDNATIPNNTGSKAEQQSLSTAKVINNKIRLTLNNVSVVEGQGVSEGDFELQIQAVEGSHNVMWPSLNGWTRVDKDGTPFSIDEDIATYTISSDSLTKSINLSVTEIDGGFNGGDDTGSGSVTITMKPGMAPVTKSAYITLDKPNGGKNGKVKVTIKAQVA